MIELRDRLSEELVTLLERYDTVGEAMKVASPGNAFLRLEFQMMQDARAELLEAALSCYKAVLAFDHSGLQGSIVIALELPESRAAEIVRGWLDTLPPFGLV